MIQLVKAPPDAMLRALALLQAPGANVAVYLCRTCKTPQPRESTRYTP